MAAPLAGCAHISKPGQQLMALIWIIHCFAVKNACPAQPNKEGCREGTATQTPVAFRFAGRLGFSDHMQQLMCSLHYTITAPIS